MSDRPRVFEEEIRRRYAARYPLSVDTESDVTELMVTLDLLWALGLTVAPGDEAASLRGLVSAGESEEPGQDRTALLAGVVRRPDVLDPAVRRVARPAALAVGAPRMRARRRTASRARRPHPRGP